MKDKTPNYYTGKVYGYKAFDIIEDYELNYNCARTRVYNYIVGRVHAVRTCNIV